MRACFIVILTSVLGATAAGCRAYSLDIDGRIEERAAASIDRVPMTTFTDPIPPTQLPKELPRESAAENPPDQIIIQAAFAGPSGSSVQSRDVKRGRIEDKIQLTTPTSLRDVTPVSAEQAGDDKKPTSIMDRLRLPEELRSFGGADIKLPPFTAPRGEIEAAIKKQFPPLPELPNLPAGAPGPSGAAMTLEELQQLGLRGNPAIRQAHLDVEAARGVALQVGLYPNPSVGYEGDTIGQANNDGKRSAGQQGGFVEQLVVTAGKRQLARQAAQRDVWIAEQKLKAAESEVQTQIRTLYFAVLSARKNFDVSRSLAQLTDEVFGVLLLQLRVGEVAAYEPMQLRVLAMQSRGLLIQSHNRYLASWKQLAAVMGAPNLPLTQLAGKIDMPVPHFDHETVLAYVLRNHSSVVSASLGVERDQTLLRLAEAQPIPDIGLHWTVSKDTTAPPYFVSHNVFASIPVPLYNRNQGGIQQARALLQKSNQENFRVYNDLTGRVAEVFNRYENNRMLLEMYKKQMLPNQVQAFRAALARHAALGAKDISYNDVVTAQQNLANLLGNYLTALSDQWTAVSDIGNLLQTKDIFQTRPTDEVAPIPDVQEIFREVVPGHRRR